MNRPLGAPSIKCGESVVGSEGKSGICGLEYTIEQLAENFMTWARANEALLDIDMLAGATLAFEQRWPCGERRKSKH